MCNSGVSLTPVVDGEVHHFAAGGLYDGLFLMWDRESGSYWNHITGLCMHGALKGAQLPVSFLEQRTAGQILAAHPQAVLAWSQQPLWMRLVNTIQYKVIQPRGRGFIPPHFYRTMPAADDRLPRLAIGLGIWQGKAARFYPLKALQSAGGLIWDYFQGRDVLLFIDQLSGTPQAVFVEKQAYTWQDGEVHLESEQTYIQGQWVQGAGELIDIPAPEQLFSRWYGFSYTFPECEIFSGRADGFTA